MGKLHQLRGELSEGYEWQETYPVDLTQYLAVRVWYERELIKQACEGELGIEGTYPRIAAWIEREQNAANSEKRNRTAQLSAAVRLHDLADGLEIAPGGLTDAPADQLRTLLDWIDAYPVAEHGPVWLKAFEAGYQEASWKRFVRVQRSRQRTNRKPVPTRKRCSASMSVPNHFDEASKRLGNYETIGFAGFFTVFIPPSGTR